MQLCESLLFNLWVIWLLSPGDSHRYCLLQASSTKKFQASRPVISFCTAVIVEVLGCVATIDSDIVKRIHPFVASGLQTGTKGGSDHKVNLKA